MGNILTSIPSPTLESPLGGGFYSGKEINISWKKIDTSSEMYWYEVFITDNFLSIKESSWVQIAMLPHTEDSFTYNINKNLKGEKCRVAVRSKDFRGNVSEMSFSPNNFTILGSNIPSPVVFSPEPEETYFSSIPFVFDYGAILGRGSNKTYFQIFYKSEKLSIDWTLLREGVLLDSLPFDVDITGLNSSNDYQIRVELVNGKYKSSPVIIKNIKINNDKFFLIDTTPPKGSIEIQNNQEYTNNRNTIISLNYNDDITDVKDFYIEQDSIEEDSSFSTNYMDITNLMAMNIVGNDGEKLIKAIFRDYGDNVIMEEESSKFFRTYKNLENRRVSAMYFDSNYLYYSFDENNDGVFPLYRDQSFINNSDYEIVCMYRYVNSLYISAKDSNNKGIFQRLSGNEIVDIVNNSSEYLNSKKTIINFLYDPDSYIKSMVVYKDLLFLGLQNGELLSFDGSLMSSVYSENKYSKSIKELFTDNGLLYCFFENDLDILVVKYDDEEYEFKTLSLEK